MKIYYIIFFIIIHTVCISQTSEGLMSNSSVSVSYQNGHIFATNDFLKGNNIESEKIKNFETLGLRFIKQTTGTKIWEQVYKYPNWGFAIQPYNFHNPEELGIPISLYSFFNAPFVRWNKVSCNYEICFGASFNWKSYNPITNKYNNAIGANQAFLIDVGMNLRYYFIKNFEFDCGFSLTHFSNGALKKPNYGINTIAPKVALKYNMFNQAEFEKTEIPKFIKNNELAFSLFGGIKNVIFDSLNINIIEKYEGVFFPVFGISTVFQKQINYKSKIGFGMSVSYNSSLDAQVAIYNNELEIIDSPFLEKLQVSIYPSYELVVNKFSLLLQPAFYIYRKKIKNQTPVFYQRIGLKYQFTNTLFAGIILRDYEFHVSDFIEWNIGYRFKK